MPRSIKLALTLSLVSLAAAIWAAAGAAGDARLDAISSEIATHPVTVQCAQTPHEWAQIEDANHLTFETDAFSYPGGNVMYLSPLVCDTLTALLKFPVAQIGPYYAARAIKVFIHESVHLGGIVDERTTDCVALSLMGQRFAERFGYTRTIKTTVYVRKGKLYKRVVKTATNPAYTQLMAWANYWHLAVPSFGGAC